MRGGNGRFVVMGALCACLWAALPARAQNPRDVRINLHPNRTQVGVVTRVVGRSAWVRMPQYVRTGAQIDFLAFSDGGDVLAVGRVQWVAPVAPYEAYVVDIHPVATSHPANEYNSLFATEALTKETTLIGSSPESDANGVDIAAGFFARAALVPAPPQGAIEPVRAHIAALRALNTPSARALADAAAHTLIANPVLTEDLVPEDEAVDYTALGDVVQRFRRLRISDPITARVLERFKDLVEDADLGVAVPSDFLRAPNQIPLPGVGGGGLGAPRSY